MPSDAQHIQYAGRVLNLNCCDLRHDLTECPSDGNLDVGIVFGKDKVAKAMYRIHVLFVFR